MQPIRLPALICTIVFLLTAPGARGEDAYYRVPVADVQMTEGERPGGLQPAEMGWRRQRQFHLRVVLAGGADAEGYVAGSNERAPAWSSDVNEWALYVRAPKGQPVNGALYSPGTDGSIRVMRFTIPATAADEDHRISFHRARALHHQQLRQRDLPGAAWFRHQEQLSREVLHETETPDQVRQRNVGTRGELTETYGLYTGGRAVSENLQLDRVLPPSTQPQTEEVALSGIAGIEVKEMDWKPLLEGLNPKPDPLAALIPADQHAMFFPSIQQAQAVLELAEKHAVPALQSIEPQTQTARVRQRYERQLGQTVSDLAKLAERGLITAIAVTGSDPYVRVGTDLAILFETTDASTLALQLTAPLSASGAKPVQIEVDGLTVFGGANADRTVSGYVAVIGDAVALTNSLEQMKRLAAVRGRKAESIVSLPEYTFFRSRYIRREGDESAFLIISDATIRRWCGPRWRIADSRRTRAAAVLAQLHAANLRTLIAAEASPPRLESDRFVPQLGEMQFSGGGIDSSTYNTLAFMTPIAELNLDKVTQAEADAYGAWRDGYQRNWSWGFDPIAFRLSLRPSQIAGDLTVMPLIDFSRYRDLVEISRGAAIAPGSGDPHEGTLAHFVYAINSDAPQMKEWSQTVSSVVPQLKVSPIDWIGQSVAVYLDEDPFWVDVQSAEDREEFLMQNIGRLPVGLYAQVRQPLKLAAVLTAMRGFIESSAPNLTRWQTPQHNGRTYVKITANLGPLVGDDLSIAICYATSPQSFTLALNEDLLKRAIDRDIAREIASTRPAEGKLAATQPWLGSSLALQVSPRFLDVPQFSSGEDMQAVMQRLAWANLPILNEWKRLFPDRDPLEVHEKAWHVRPADPAGGAYVWNDKWQTMESSVFGHPGEPKTGPATPPMLEAFKRGNFGVDFEHQGLRAKAVLDITDGATTQPR